MEDGKTELLSLICDTLFTIFFDDITYLGLIVINYGAKQRFTRWKLPTTDKSD